MLCFPLVTEESFPKYPPSLMAEKVKIKRDSLVKKLTKKVRGSTCRTDSCVSLSEEPSGGTAGAPVLKNRVQQEALLGVGAEAEVFPEGLW